MIAKLTPELQAAIRERGTTPLQLIDPTTNLVYVLLPREQYDRLRPLFDDGQLSEQEQRQLLIDAGRRAGWDDPEMAAYDNYDEHRAKQL